MPTNRLDGKKSTGSEIILGTDKDEWIYPLGGSDTVDGRGGYDTVVVEWESTNFKIATYPGVTYLDTISGASSGDKVTLLNVEAVKFSDKTVLLYKDLQFTNNPGGEVFQGHWGLDAVTYEGARNQYTVTVDATGVDVRDSLGSDGTDRLIDIERVHFKDVSLALDFKGHAGAVAKTLGAVFGPEMVHNKAVAGIALHLLDKLDFSDAQLMELALGVRLGNEVNNIDEVVRLLYTNVVGAAPSVQAVEGLAGLIRSGEYSVLSFAMMASQIELNLARVGLMGAVTVPLEYLSPDA